MSIAPPAVMAGAARSVFVSLVVFGLAFGWIEAAVVIYLREINPGALDTGTGLPLVLLPPRVLAVEVVREACTLLVLGAVAWLTSVQARARIGAFLLLFGIWDLTYYAVLRAVSGWPASLAAWDVLFLIPLPWVAPVWAPASVATLFILAGTYLIGTADRERRYGWRDAAILATAAVVVVVAFLVEWEAPLARRAPHDFPDALFWAGVLLGLSWFIHVERPAATLKRRRVAARTHHRRA
jgi:hypothetical protein